MIDHSAGDSEQEAQLAVAGLARSERDINSEKRGREKANKPAFGSIRAALIALVRRVVELVVGHYQRQGWNEAFRTSSHL